MDSNATNQARLLADKIQWLQEPEAGDFRRKIGLYVLRFEQSLSDLEWQKCRPQIQALKSLVMFDPEGSIESTRQKAVHLFKDIAEQKA